MYVLTTTLHIRKDTMCTMSFNAYRRHGKVLDVYLLLIHIEIFNLCTFHIHAMASRLCSVSASCAPALNNVRLYYTYMHVSCAGYWWQISTIYRYIRYIYKYKFLLWNNLDGNHSIHICVRMKAKKKSLDTKPDEWKFIARNMFDFTYI